MNRTTAYVLFGALSLAGTLASQTPAPAPSQSTQASIVKDVVAKMVKAERGLKSLRMTMKTSSKMPGGLDLATSGELRVLRGTQPEAPVRRFSRLEYSFGDGVRGRMESAETAAGILVFEEDPAFGSVFLRIEPSVVRDLEWAGTVLERADLPGMVDARARTPLGSGLVAEMLRTFDLAVDERKEREGVRGTWIVGARKAGLDDQDPDLPLADRVEVFVRGADHALLAARYMVGEDLLQQLEVTDLQVDPELKDEDFVVDGQGVRLRSAQEHAPMWEQIEQALQRAEDKSADGVLRPSRRAAAGDDKPGDKPGDGGK